MRKDLTVSWAASDDIDQIFELAYEMWAEMGYADVDDSWQPAARQVMSDQIASGQAAVAVVRDPSDASRLVSCGVGLIHQRLPQWWSTSGRIGYICWMSTRASHRGQGCATAILDELLRWFAANQTDIVDLNTTSDGRQIYERAGFTAPAYDVLRWHLPVESAAD